MMSFHVESESSRVVQDFYKCRPFIRPLEMDSGAHASELDCVELDWD